MFKITKAYIESLATNQSFSRGRSYYQRGEVMRVIQKGDTFTGEVLGSEVYEVSIVFRDKSIVSSCTCPYDWGGICKHIVAVGLAIADGDFKKDDLYVSEEYFFDHIFDGISDEVKNAFLIRCIQQDSSKRAEIMQMAGIKLDKKGNIIKKIINRNPNDPAYTGIDITELADEIRARFAAFDFDYYHKKGYYNDDEYDNLFQVNAKEYIKKIIQEEYDLYSPHFRNLHFVEGFKAMCALYEATQNMPIPENKDYDVKEDFEMWAAIEIQHLWRNNLSEAIALAPKTAPDIYQSIDIWTNQLLNYKNDDDISYNFTIWQDIIEVMLIDGETAKYILEKMRQNDLITPNSAHLSLMLADATEDTAYWLQLAEEFAPSDRKISFELFDKYISLQQKNDALRLAKLLFEKYPDQADEYILPYLSPIENKALFLNVASHLAARKRDINGYQALCQLWTEAEKKQFIEHQRGKDAFYIQLLTSEERYDDALKYLKNRPDSLYFSDMAKPIINYFPLEIIEIIDQKITKAMALSKTRNTYHEIAQWLIPLLDITEEKQTAMIFIHNLINVKYPKLPALKDEIKKAGLLTTK